MRLPTPAPHTLATHTAHMPFVPIYAQGAQAAYADCAPLSSLSKTQKTERENPGLGIKFSEGFNKLGNFFIRKVIKNGLCVSSVCNRSIFP